MPQVFISHLMAAINAAHAKLLERDNAVTTKTNALIQPVDCDHINLTPPETALHTQLGTNFTVLTLNIRGNRQALRCDIPCYLQSTAHHDALVLTEIGLKVTMLITGDIFNGCQAFHVFIPRFLDIFCFQAVMVVLMFY